MSQPKWQPGPWKVDPDHRPGMAWNRHIVFGDGDGRICFMAHSGGGNPERDQANANLIAAAPELYAALDGLLAAPRETAAAAEIAARAALAKARGEQ